MKQYRIGDFARYLGVTPDLLKHYEDLGIIRPKRSESGYRYYPFQTTMLLIECIRLRNYGMTLREIREILTLHSEEDGQVALRLEENVSHLRDEMLLDEALMEEYRRFREWKEPLQDRDQDWDIRWGRPMCFLPHTDRDDFLHDGRIYELVKDWMSFIPIVKSCMRVEQSGQVTWGFVVQESDLQRLRIPVNGVVERIPPSKVFYYKFRGELIRLPEEHADSRSHPAFRQLRALNLEPAGTYYRTTLMPADWQRDIIYQYGYYAVPIRV
ncbi:MAG: MerR family transcriptional regulator [Oscillospiraceae bacterium]|nr:MerR family transcriptional regulator [Oscillospiraceae bacterium]